MYNGLAIHLYVLRAVDFSKFWLKSTTVFQNLFPQKYKFGQNLFSAVFTAILFPLTFSFVIESLFSVNQMTTCWKTLSCLINWHFGSMAESSFSRTLLRMTKYVAGHFTAVARKLQKLVARRLFTQLKRNKQRLIFQRQGYTKRHWTYCCMKTIICWTQNSCGPRNACPLKRMIRMKQEDRGYTLWQPKIKVYCTMLTTFH